METNGGLECRGNWLIMAGMATLVLLGWWFSSNPMAKTGRTG